MAKVTKQGLAALFSGQVAGLVFRQMPDGSVWVSQAPDFSSRRFSPDQLQHQSRFQQASSYAKAAAKKQPVYAERAAGTVKTAYNIALSDWFHAPVIHQVRRDAGRILVEAGDDVVVTRVRVTITDEAGATLDQGDAIRGQGDWWEFVSEVEGKLIVAEAWDLPRHVTRFELENGRA